MRWHFVQSVAVCASALWLSSCGGSGGGGGEEGEGRSAPETEEVEIGYRGEARVNPFLAAERLSARMGMAADSHMYLIPLPDSDGTMVVPAEAVVGTGIAGELARWIRDGGHLIYLVSGGDSAADDFPESPNRSFYEAEVEVDHALLEAFRIKVVPDDPAVSRVNWVGKSYDCHFEKGPRIDFSGFTGRRGAGWKSSVSGPEDAAVFGSFSIGSGRLTVLADAQPWRNRFILENGNSVLFWDVISQGRGNRGWGGPGELTIVIGLGSSFWALLMKHGWMALVALVLVVAAWLWKNLTRFGPPLIVGDDHFREFKENVAVAGTFLWSKRRSDVLLDVVRRRIGAALRRTHATLELDSAETPSFLAGKSGVPEARVAEVLRAHGTRDASTMVRLMRDLQTVEASL